jgi:signal transduction histidine kinase/PAS domain-containing protein
MKGKKILVVDDDKNYREGLIESLQQEGAIGIGARSGEEAINLVAASPEQFHFAVVDQMLKGSLDGIQTTQELVNLNRNLFVLVFTNIPSDSIIDISRFKYEAFAAGAFRYLERGSAINAPKQIKDFVTEIEKLISLRDWIQDYYEGREQVPSLLTQLDIGVDIIDSSYKIWFMNNAMRRIIGLQGQDLPRQACPGWHGFRFCPCPGCLIKNSFEDCRSHFKVFLAPLPNRDPEKLFYMNVWTQLVRDRNGEILTGRDGNPLAAMESVQDMTGSEQLKKMPLEDRMILISRSLQQRSIDNEYIVVNRLKKVEIYVRDQNNFFILKTPNGDDQSHSLTGPVDFYGEGSLFQAEEKMKETGRGSFLPENKQHEQIILWPVLTNDKTVALMKITGNGLTENVFPIISPYAKEVNLAYIESEQIDDIAFNEVEQAIVKIDSNLQMIASPRDALKSLVTSACELTKSFQAVLRYREKDEAVLLKLGVEEYSAYEKITEIRIPISHTSSLSCQAMVSGQEIIANQKSNRDMIQRRYQELSDEAQTILRDVKAICFMPLLLDGRCIGSLGFYSMEPECYTKNEPKIIREIARRTALALHDFLVEQNAELRIQVTQFETISLVLHNIYTPLGNINYSLDLLKNYCNQKYPSDPHFTKQLSDLNDQTNQITKVRSEFLKLRQEWQSRIENVDIKKLTNSIIKRLMRANRETVLTIDFIGDFGIISIDALALKECVEVLIDNSFDALENQQADKKILVTLRETNSREYSYLSSNKPGLCIDIEDNGPGIPTNIVKDLFQIIRSGKAKGLGFGLAYCKKVAKSARGDVYYHEEHNNGAKFTLVLPFEQVILGRDDENSRC